MHSIAISSHQQFIHFVWHADERNSSMTIVFLTSISSENHTSDPEFNMILLNI